jgi:hypothetical protein
MDTVSRKDCKMPGECWENEIASLKKTMRTAIIEILTVKTDNGALQREVKVLGGNLKELSERVSRLERLTFHPLSMITEEI